MQSHATLAALVQSCTAPATLVQACAAPAVHARSGAQGGVLEEARRLEEALGSEGLVGTKACHLEEASRLAEAGQALAQLALTFGPVRGFGGTVALSLSAWRTKLTALWQGSALLGTTSARRIAMLATSWAQCRASVALDTASARCAASAAL